MPIEILVMLWVVLLIGLFVVRGYRKTEGVGLVTVYLLNLVALHGLTGAIRLLPVFREAYPKTRIGMELSTLALGGFIVGSLLLAPIIRSINVSKRDLVKYTPAAKLPRVYLGIGVFGFLFGPWLGRIPSLSGPMAAAEMLYVVGICLVCWSGFQRRNAGTLLLCVGLTGLIPIVTIVSSGFMGFGASAALVVFGFCTTVYPRRKMLLASVFLAYFGLSCYVTYMRDRNEIRRSVWGGESLSKRLGRTGETAADFELFDPNNVQHLTRLDMRLNQNFLVGVAVDRMAGTQSFANGETLWLAMVALVPRAIWPDKPAAAGSGDLVSRYTGITFAAGTSVGVGQVLEFYINFGRAGVVVGFLLLGALLTLIDIRSREKLMQGDHQGFALWMMSGLPLMQVGGSMMEAVTGTVSAIVTIALINRYFLSSWKKKASTSSPYPRRPLAGVRTPVENIGAAASQNR